MMIRYLIAAIVCVATTDLFAQVPPHNAPWPQDVRGRRAWRDQAVEYVGPTARTLVETEDIGDDAATALLAVSKAVAKQLVAFHEAGGLGKLPSPKTFLQAVIRRSDCLEEVLVWAIAHGEDLVDPDAFEAFIASPLEYVLGLKSLSSGGAEIRKRLSASQAAGAPEQSVAAPGIPTSVGRSWACGAGIIGLIAVVIWRKRFVHR